MKTGIIGIEVATQPKLTGVAFAEFGEPCVRLIHEMVGDPCDEIIKFITEYDRVLIAMDAPLGWPVPFANALANHSAGGPLHDDPNDIFKRFTDKFVKEKIGKQPLDIGADRIARTAHAVLKILERLRAVTGEPIPLAWNPDFPRKGLLH